MLKPLILIGLFFFCVICKAQKHESPATLVTTHHDTLEVWVNVNGLASNLHSIRIKRDSLNEVRDLAGLRCQ